MNNVEASQDSTSKLVEIISAQNGRIVEENGEKIQFLRGGVRLRQNDTFFFSDRATNYDRQGRVILEGKVVIVDKSDTLWAERVDYSSINKIGKAYENVRLTDGEAIISSKSAIYNLEKKWADFEEPLSLEDSSIVLESNRGAYDLNKKVAIFEDDVILYEESSTILADSLTHFRNTGITNADGKVAVFYNEEKKDSLSQSWNELALFGDRLRYSRNDSLSLVSGNPFAMQVKHDSTQSDTLGIRAEKFRLKQDARSDSLSASGKVQLWNKDYQSVSDSLSYVKVEGSGQEVLEILIDPILWSGVRQITGDSLRILLKDQEIDSLLVLGDTFVAAEVSATGKINQSRAINLYASFVDGQASSMLFTPAAEAVFFQVDESDSTKVNAFKLASEAISFSFENGEIKQVRAEKNEGTYFEHGSIPSNLSLPGFEWLEANRPKREHVLVMIQTLSAILANRNE